MPTLRTSESISKIAPALHAAQAAAKLVGKEGFNQHDKYRYAELIDFWLASHALLADNDLSILASVHHPIEGNTEKQTRGGATWAIRFVAATIRIVHTSGEWIEIDTAGEGHDSGDKGVYKAITGARKYGIAQLLNLATSDDPEKESPQTNATPATQNEAPQDAGGKKKSALKDRAKQGGRGGTEAPAASSNEPTFTDDDCAKLQVALEERGLGLEDLTQAMNDAGVETPGSLREWPRSWKDRIRKWLESQPTLGDEAGG